MRSVEVFVLILTIIGSGLSQLDVCKEYHDFSFDTFKIKDKKYIYFAQEKSWSDAMDSCAKKGMNLLTIQSEEENRLLADYFTKRVYGNLTEDYDSYTWNIWSSGSDAKKQWDWIWASTNEKVTFTSWEEDEPNGGPDEDCIELRFSTPTKFLWNDSICRFRKRYICEVFDDNKL